MWEGIGRGDGCEAFARRKEKEINSHRETERREAQSIRNNKPLMNPLLKCSHVEPLTGHTQEPVPEDSSFFPLKDGDECSNRHRQHYRSVGSGGRRKSQCNECNKHGDREEGLWHTGLIGGKRW